MGCNETHTFGDGHVSKCDVIGPHDLHHTIGPTSMHGKKMWTTPAAPAVAEPKRRVGDLPAAPLPKPPTLAFDLGKLNPFKDTSPKPCGAVHAGTGQACTHHHAPDAPDAVHYAPGDAGTKIWDNKGWEMATAPKTAAKFVTRITKF